MVSQASTPENWVDFFNSTHSLYVNERHAWLHSHDLARIMSPLIPQGGRVLDYACGATQAATVLADRCSELVLWDAAEQVRSFLHAKYDAKSGISVWQNDQLGSLDERFDVIIIHSLSQYLSLSELKGLLLRARSSLSSDGFVLLGDVVGDEVTPFHDAYALLRYGFEGGFFCAAVWGLCKTAFSRYRVFRQSLGFYHYNAADVFSLSDELGFSVETLPQNLGHNPFRSAYVLRLSS